MAQRAAALSKEQPGWERQLHEQLKQTPAWNGVWHSIGPFQPGSLDDVHQGRFAPDVAVVLDAGVDPRPVDAQGHSVGERLKNTASELRWTKEIGWLDGRDWSIDLPKDSVRYFHTVLHMREAGSAVLNLSTEAPLRVTLDGQQVYDSGTKGRRKPPEVTLKLQPGEHSLVIKVSSLGKELKLRASLAQWNGKRLPRFEIRRDALELLSGAVDSLPAEMRAAVVAQRVAADGQAQQLQRKIDTLKFRMAYHTQRPFPERTQFSDAFGQPKRETACACERSSDPTLDQALNLLNGQETLTASIEGARKYASFDGDALAEEIYLSAFARRPSDAERARIAAYLKRSASRHEAVRDLLWTVFNTQEFLFQH